MSRQFDEWFEHHEQTRAAAAASFRESMRQRREADPFDVETDAAGIPVRPSDMPQAFVELFEPEDERDLGDWDEPGGWRDPR